MHPMSKKTWLCYLGALLLASAGFAVVTASQPAAMQSSAKKKTSAPPKKKSAPTSKKRSTSSKKKSRRTAHVQAAPTPDRIREIQAALKREGALETEPNGKWDKTTVEAMTKYQGDHGLNPTGKIDALTLQKLGLGSETAGKGAPTPLTTLGDPPSKSAP
jgi:peptidoglycan hydrolase-like protein with peptidoglycan-binding domain